MSFVIFATWVLVGLLAGLLAGLVMKRGGYGLKRDIALGLVGSIGGSVLLRTVGFPEQGLSRWLLSRSSERPSRSSLNARFGPLRVLARRRRICGGGGGWAQRSWPWWPGWSSARRRSGQRQ